MATMRVWWHEASSPGTRGQIPLRREPELSAENVTTSGTAAASGPCPERAYVAVLLSTTRTYFRVRRQGNTTDATTSDKPITANELTEIAVEPGDTISFIE